MDFNKVFFYILYKQIERMHNFTSWAFKKDYVMPWSLSDKRVSIKSWHLVIHDLPSLVCLNKVSYLSTHVIHKMYKSINVYLLVFISGNFYHRVGLTILDTSVLEFRDSLP